MKNTTKKDNTSNEMNRKIVPTDSKKRSESVGPLLEVADYMTNEIDSQNNSDLENLQQQQQQQSAFFFVFLSPKKKTPINFDFFYFSFDSFLFCFFFLVFEKNKRTKKCIKLFLFFCFPNQFFGALVFVFFVCVICCCEYFLGADLNLLNKFPTLQSNTGMPSHE